jgi:hypothetical protein
MDNSTHLAFNVTPSQHETIVLRAAENGFDDISNYLKVVALKMQNFKIKAIEAQTEEANVEVGFSVNASQMQKIEDNMKESECKKLSDYLLYTALHAVVSAVIEVRSTGSLNDMLSRIGKSRNLEI